MNSQFRSMNIFVLIVLTIITLGCYIPYWFYKNLSFLNSLKSSVKINKTSVYIT